MSVHGYGAYMAWEQEQLRSQWFADTVAMFFPAMIASLCDDPARQKAGIDVILTPRLPDQVPPWDRQGKTLDAKFRKKAYDDFIVEIRHDGPTVNMLGWGLRGMACDYLLYVTLENAQAVLMDWNRWWRWWLAHRSELSTRYPLQQARNRTYVTSFVTLPWSLFEGEVPLVRKPLVGYTDRVPERG